MGLDYIALQIHTLVCAIPALGTAMVSYKKALSMNDGLLAIGPGSSTSLSQPITQLPSHDAPDIILQQRLHIKGCFSIKIRQTGEVAQHDRVQLDRGMSPNPAI
jgi:hypothetical protein